MNKNRYIGKDCEGHDNEILSHIKALGKINDIMFIQGHWLLLITNYQLRITNWLFLVKNNVLRNKSYSFALRIIKAYKFLCREKSEFILSKQLLRAGTSIGANVEEALGGQSNKDFLAKLSISYKEARETHYWLRLLKDSGYFTDTQIKALIQDCEELLKIIGSIQKTLKSKIRNS